MLCLVYLVYLFVSSRIKPNCYLLNENKLASKFTIQILVSLVLYQLCDAKSSCLFTQKILSL